MEIRNLEKKILTLMPAYHIDHLIDFKYGILCIKSNIWVMIIKIFQCFLI